MESKWVRVGNDVPLYSLRDITKPVDGWYGGAEKIDYDCPAYLIITIYGPIKIRGCSDLNIHISRFNIGERIRICFGGLQITPAGHWKYVALVDRG